MEKVTDKNYSSLVIKARNAWKKEFGEDLQDELLTQLVISFLSERRREYMEMIKAQMTPAQEEGKKVVKRRFKKEGRIHQVV